MGLRFVNCDQCWNLLKPKKLFLPDANNQWSKNCLQKSNTEFKINRHLLARHFVSISFLLILEILDLGCAQPFIKCSTTI